MSPDATGSRLQQRLGHRDDALVAEFLARGEPQDLEPPDS